jgi:L-fuconolactonase
VIIDAHVHIWDLQRGTYPWLTPEVGELNRTYGFDEVIPELDAVGVDGVVLVQAADDVTDTRRMLGAARRFPQVLGVVAWAPLDRPDLLPDHLAELRHDPYVVGVRNLIHDHSPYWLAEPDVDRGLAVLAAAGLPLDFVTSSPAALAELPRICSRHPDLRIVIDHLGKPPIGASGPRREWLALIASAAAHPQVSAKVSGLYATEGKERGRGGVREYILDSIALFGVERLMFGSDWPIVAQAGGYERFFDDVRSSLDQLTETDRVQVMGATAARFYGLEGEKNHATR